MLQVDFTSGNLFSQHTSSLQYFLQPVACLKKKKSKQNKTKETNKYTGLMILLHMSRNNATKNKNIKVQIYHFAVCFIFYITNEKKYDC